MNVYEIITSKIIDKLKEGVVPWQKPFVSGYPQNLISKKPYRGINPLLLAVEGRSTPYWLTYNQAKKLKGNVKKGEKSTVVVFWKFVEKENGDNFPILRYYRVFNLDQTEGIEAPVEEKRENSPIECAEEIISNMPFPPEICRNGQAAFYQPLLDKVVIPSLENFVSSESFYSVLFHELTHSTMHEKRCNRDCGSHQFGSKDYSKEELVAEMGACYLNAHCGIEGVFDNSASYIDSWLKKLSSDMKFVVMAAAQAQKACDYILNLEASHEG